ncbi:MAG TPA: peptidylprolyl isomerase [Micrococcales bacterium]|uniref:FKBP-type peptidyl-prolyl cis-trans isomerase n=1 Tax=Miniimonas TaxID=947525 RepID=UPI000D526915|nr:FKBP-type peptidyl-prolyl cis-trans isomerase [Miniimonas arenae]HCX84940.1 peptidylprolyl isomerase [Micrococcales bacterium]
MRHRLALPAVLPAALLVGALALAGCSSDSSTESATGSADATASADASAGDAATDAAVIAGSDVGFEASGAFGEKPTLTFSADAAPEGLQVQTASAGDGATIEAGDFVVANYLGQVWNGDVFDNSYDRGAPSGFSLDGVIEGWSTGLVGQTVGSRVLLTIPSDLGYGDTGSSDGSIAAGDTIVFVVDVVDAYGAESTGQADATPTDADVPVTVDGDLGAPIAKVTVADGATEPTESSATVLATGTGDPVAAEDQVIVQYTLTTWDNADFETSWPSLGGYGMQSAAVSEGSPFAPLVGVPVGSRVLLLLPADASTESAALAVVVDVVGTVGS